MFLPRYFCSNLQRCTMAFYAVARGRRTGVYDSWAECEEQVKGFNNAKYKKFKTRQEADQFVNGCKSYAPQDVAVPLGKRQAALASWKNSSKVIGNPKYTEEWPEEDQDLAEDDLNAAMNEVEGDPNSINLVDILNRKRKATDSSYKRNKIPRHVSQVSEAKGLKQVGAFQFEIDAEGYVIVYTDGSCIGNGQPGACAGYGVYFGKNHQLNAGKPVEGRVTNNVGEIQAAIHAIKTAIDLGIQKLCVRTDSQFLINSITLWVEGWKKRGWKLKNNQPVKNVVDFKELDKLLQNNNITVKWNYVEAHKGIEGNEMADKLARQGSAMYKDRNG
ncbi:ribonuclease H1 isoform X1 [Drosophila teissieri]|uniref:ribonuclease H1 isoform X1 n=1 Tax=Drosophila teissieri TaxID=7243 RepID=UPI001CBA2DD9|nr:ribonuclease H1 isoform X1 [Drosophila teissieri]